PAIHFISDDDRSDEVCGTRTLGFSNGEACRDVIARMNGKPADICIVEVEIAESGTVGEGGHISCRLPLRANDRRGTVDGQRDLTADAHRSLIPCANSATNRIDHKRLHALDGRSIEVFVAQTRRISSEPLRKRSLARIRRKLTQAVLRFRELRSNREGGCTGAEMEKSTAGNFHHIARAVRRLRQTISNRRQSCRWQRLNMAIMN